MCIRLSIRVQVAAKLTYVLEIPCVVENPYSCSGFHTHAGGFHTHAGGFHTHAGGFHTHAGDFH